MNYDAKRIAVWLMNIGLVVTIAVGVALFGFLQDRRNEVLPARSITVTAEGKTSVTPDLALISATVLTEGKDPKKLQEDNTQKMNAVIGYLKSLGIKPADIETSNYTLNPNYRYDLVPQGTPQITGYTLNQTVTVKVRDLTKTGTIVGALPGLGINQINQVSNIVEDPDKFLNAARIEAFKKAHDKANAMAAAVGVRIKRVVTFNENQGGYPMPIYAARAESMDSKGGVPAPTPPTIEPGSQDLTVSVTVVYEIR